MGRAGTAWTDPGLVNEIPGAGPPVPLSPDPPFAVAFATDLGPIDILGACYPGFTTAIGTRDCKPSIDGFGLPFRSAAARIGGGGSTLHVIGTGPSAAAKSTSVRPYIVVAAIVAMAVLLLRRAWRHRQRHADHTEEMWTGRWAALTCMLLWQVRVSGSRLNFCRRNALCAWHQTG